MLWSGSYTILIGINTYKNMKAQFFNYKILEVKPITDLHEFKDHRRLQVFYHKGCKCIQCGREATQIALGERQGQQHWDLYTDDFYPLTLDHTIPKSKGGLDSLVNLEPMCYGCNQLKGNGGNHISICKWPRKEDSKPILNPIIGMIVFQKQVGKRGKKKNPILLGKIIKMGLNPHTSLPACITSSRPNSWFHYTQLLTIE